MSALLEVVLPVFAVIGFGYWAVASRRFSAEGADALMRFTQTFAIPVLLFRAISTLELGPTFTWPLLASFYTGVSVCFLLGLAGARWLFGRQWEDAIAIGFAAMFSNSVLLGLPITERAYGAEALEANFALVSVHAPFCFIVGITAMEIARNGAAAKSALPGKVVRAVFGNGLIIGISAGFVVNLTGLPLPDVVEDANDLIARAALPAALFGLGGVLVRYRPEGDLRTILFVIGISLVVHPAIVWGLGSTSDLSTQAFRSAVLTSAMPPGVNAYVFANMYDRAKRVAASVVLFATALSVLTAWAWLTLLP